MVVRWLAQRSIMPETPVRIPEPLRGQNTKNNTKALGVTKSNMRQYKLDRLYGNELYTDLYRCVLLMVTPKALLCWFWCFILDFFRFPTSKVSHPTRCDVAVACRQKIEDVFLSCASFTSIEYMKSYVYEKSIYVT